jgi:hypothetical protein
VYAGDNPVTNVDSDGKKASTLQWVCFGIGAIIALAAMLLGGMAIFCFIGALAEGGGALFEIGGMLAALSGAGDWECEQIFQALSPNENVPKNEKGLLEVCGLVGAFGAPLVGAIGAAAVVVGCVDVEMVECAAIMASD